MINKNNHIVIIHPSEIKMMIQIVNKIKFVRNDLKIITILID